MLNWFLTNKHEDHSNMFKNASHCACTSTNVASPSPFVSYSHQLLPSPAKTPEKTGGSW